MAVRYDNLATAMEEHGVDVVRNVPLALEQGEMVPVGNIPMYPRDPMVAVGPYIIDTFTRMEFRRKEPWGTRKAITEHVAASGQRHLSMPQPPYGVKNDGEAFPYLEGGDTFVMNDHVLVGHSGIGSSYAGIEWLRKFLEPEGMPLS
jgi:glycine amidinotransferase